MLGEDTPNGSAGSNALDPSQPLMLLAQQLESATSVTFEDPEAFVEELVGEILGLPSEERFERAMYVAEERIADEFGSLDLFESTFPIDPEFLQVFLQQLFDNGMRELAQRALAEDRPTRNGPLTVLGMLNVMQHTLEVGLAASSASKGADDGELPSVVEDLEKSDHYRLGSIYVALYCRLYREIERERAGEDPDFEAIARNVVYGEKALLDVLEPDKAYPLSPGEMSNDELLEVAIVRGALRAYDLLDISTGRGAELAGMTQSAFLDTLETSGIRPNHGPDSVEDLYSGPDLMDE